jgi:hypothetical protein
MFAENQISIIDPKVIIVSVNYNPKMFTKQAQVIK